jgi:hypothetical protein
MECLVVWIWRRVSQLDELTMMMMSRQVLKLLAVFAFLTSALSLSGQSTVGHRAFVAAAVAATFNLSPDTSVHELTIPCWILLSNSGRTRWILFWATRSKQFLSRRFIVLASLHIAFLFHCHAGLSRLGSRISTRFNRTLREHNDSGLLSSLCWQKVGTWQRQILFLWGHGVESTIANKTEGSTSTSIPTLHLGRAGGNGNISGGEYYTADITSVRIRRPWIWTINLGTKSWEICLCRRWKWCGQLLANLDAIAANFTVDERWATTQRLFDSKMITLVFFNMFMCCIILCLWI